MTATARKMTDTGSICDKLDKAVKAKGGSENALDILDTEAGTLFIEVIADLLVSAERITFTSHKVCVKCKKSFANMVAVGKYDEINDNVTAENFPIAGEGTIKSELILIYFPDATVESDEVIDIMKQLGLVPAKIEHLLALGAQHPDLQKEYPIIALGSSWVTPDGESKFVPFIGFNNDVRILELYLLDDEYYGLCRFAAVRQP